jgi:heat shock protein HslJ
VHFSQDGTWHGSDGCNGQSGRWKLEPDGAFEASANPSTDIGCDNVEVGLWLAQARTADLGGNVLVLRDAEGDGTGRFQRLTG